MKIYTEKNLYNFEFWSGAKDTANALNMDEMNQIEAILEDRYPDGIDETTLNDIFWFEDTIAEWLGFETWEALERNHNGEEESHD